MINSQGLLLSVLGDEYFVSFGRLPWMKTASVADVLNVRLCGRHAVEWPTLDVDLEIESLRHPDRYPLVMRRFEGEEIG